MSGKKKIIGNASNKTKESDLVQNNVNHFLTNISGNNNIFGNSDQINNKFDFLSNPSTLFRSLRNYPISNFRNFCADLYMEHGLVRTLIDVPVEDGFSGGPDIFDKGGELDDDDLAILDSEIEMKQDFQSLAQANKWAGLYGGGAIIVVHEDQNPENEFSIDDIQKGDEIEFMHADVWELYAGVFKTSGYGTDKFIKPYHDIERESFQYYGNKIHSSRILKILGEVVPSINRGQFVGWGASKIEHLIRPMTQFILSNNVIFELMSEAKIDVLKIGGMFDRLKTQQGSEEAAKALQSISYLKNYLGMMAIDREDDFVSRTMNFAGLKDIMSENKAQLASELRMPISKLFQTGSPGLNNGEADLETYNRMIESSVRDKVKHAALTMMKVRCQSLFGFVPEGLDFNFKPLRTMTEEQEENIKNIKINRIVSLAQGGIISPKETKEMINASEVLPMKLKVNDEIFDEFLTEVDITTKEPDKPIT